MTRRRKVLSGLAVVGVVLLGAAGMLLLTSFRPQAARDERVAEIRTVKTLRIQSAPQKLMIDADGFVKSARVLEIRSPLGGRVAGPENALNGGTRVEKGDLLLLLDDRRARLAFENARTELTRLTYGFITSAGLSAGESDDWNRYLANLNGADFADLPAPPPLEGRTRLLAATLGVTGAVLAVESAALDLSDHRVPAPFSGTISGDGIAPGSMVSPGMVLATLVDTDHLEVPLSVDESRLNRISVGSPVSVVRTADGISADGRISRIEALLLPGSQTARVHVSLDTAAGSGWIPGLYVSARISGPEYESAVRIPRKYLLDGSLPVYRSGSLSLLPVNILGFDGGDVILAPDFPPDTEVVITVLQTPMEGLPLKKEGE